MQLRAAGIIPLTTQDATGPRIRQVHGHANNRLFGLQRGGTGLVVRVEIVTEVRLQIREFRIEVPWDVPELELLEDPGPRRSAVYKFPEKDRSQFPRKEVLNHCTGVWPRRTAKEGLFVAYTNGGIPSQFTRGEVTVELVVEDVWNHIYKRKLQVATDSVIDYFKLPERNSEREPIFGVDWKKEAGSSDEHELEGGDEG